MHSFLGSVNEHCGCRIRNEVVVSGETVLLTIVGPDDVKMMLTTTGCRTAPVIHEAKRPGPMPASWPGSPPSGRDFAPDTSSPKAITTGRSLRRS